MFGTQSPSFDWSNLRVAVTGGAGFLGRAVCDRLRDRGATEVSVPRQADFDLTDPVAVGRFFDEAQPEVVFHLAAEFGGLGAIPARPGRFFFANMAMGLNLIEEARRRGVRKFVQTGSSSAYPKFTPVPFREEDLWNGFPDESNAPYAVAKNALLVMLQAYREQYGFPGIHLVPANLYGPSGGFDRQQSHVIPALIRRFAEAKERGARSVEVWGTGQATREFLYVDDCAEGIVRAAEIYDGPDPINLGTGREVTIRELAEQIRDLVGFSGEIFWDTSKPEGQPRRCLDIQRARQLCGFEPTTSLEAGLQRTVESWTSLERTPAKA